MLKTWPASIALIVLTLAPLQSQARDWGTVSGWFVSSAGETCGMFAQNPNASGTEIVILKRLDGTLFVQVKNAKWLRTGGVVTYQVDNTAYDGPFSVSAIDKGYIATFGEGFERDLQGGTTLTVKRDAVVLDQIALTGSAAALGTVRNCLAELKSGASTIQALQQNAKVKGDSSKWIAFEDYPATALRDKHEGVVAFRLIVGRDGRASQCLVTKSSGHSDLDNATCTAMMRRSKFSPALGSNGTPVEGFFESKVSWKLPE
jgi:periplasmic protein TonB